MVAKFGAIMIGQKLKDYTNGFVNLDWALRHLHQQTVSMLNWVVVVF